jgi:hypothetical protein
MYSTHRPLFRTRTNYSQPPWILIVMVLISDIEIANVKTGWLPLSRRRRALDYQMASKGPKDSFFRKLIHRKDRSNHAETKAPAIPPSNVDALRDPQTPKPPQSPISSVSIRASESSETPHSIEVSQPASSSSQNDIHETGMLPPCEQEFQDSTTFPVPERLEQYGLLPLTGNADDAALDSQSPDIIAIHGINGDAYKTWTHENGSLWLRDFLPEHIAGARVFSFGYPSEVAFTKAKGSIIDFGRTLLEQLKAYRLGEVCASRCCSL